MGKYGKKFRDCCDSPTDGKHVNGCPLSTVNISVSIEDCFDDNGYIKFDPYRFHRETATPYSLALYDALFREDGYLKDRGELCSLINANKKKWQWSCTAIALYHAETLASATKGSYPTYYYFR